MKKYIIIGIIILFITVVLLALYLPFFNIRNAIYNETVRNTKLNKTSEIIVKDYNPFSPLIIIVPKIGSEELQKQQAGMFIVRYRRTSLTSFKEVGVGQVISRNKTANELVEIAKNQNLIGNNPDKENLVVPCVEGKCPERKGRPSDEDRYFDPKYLGENDNPSTTKQLGNFNLLKKGFTYNDVENIVGKPDRATGRGLVTGKDEQHYKMKENNIAFIIIAFDKDADDFPNEAKLEEVKIVYNDRRVEDLPLQQK